MSIISSKMEKMSSISSLLLIYSLFLACVTISVATTDPDLKQCRDKCLEQKEHFGTKKTDHREKERRQGGRDVVVNVMDPWEKYKQCRIQCHIQSEISSYPECAGDCMRQLAEREKERETTSQGREREMEEGEHPYVFGERHLITWLQMEHGRVRFVPKFTDRSNLLRGIENYRISVFEAEPQAFVVPNHWDVDFVSFVSKGRGTVSLVTQDKRESFNIKEGDIVRFRAGTTMYLINPDKKEKLIITNILVPVNIPGEFQTYFGTGGESFYSVFSDELLEAAFNTKIDKIQRLFGPKRQEIMLKASKEQIRAMSRHKEGGIWPFGGGSRGTINLYEQRPTHSNQYGQLYEVDSRQFEGLRDLDIAVSLANITQGAMTAPTYSSKATKIAIVIEGEGYFEMACPHISGTQGGHQEQQHGSQRGTTTGPSYQRVSSRLSPGMVVVVQAGHPFVAVASEIKNLKVLFFEVKAPENYNFRLTGRWNLMSHLEIEAKELAFGMPAIEVDEVFGSQLEDYFFKGPRQQQQQHQGRAEM